MPEIESANAAQLEFPSAEHEAQFLLDTVKEIAARKAEYIAQLLKNRAEIDRALELLGAKRVRRPRAEAKRKPGRPRGSRNRVTAETEAISQ